MKRHEAEVGVSHKNVLSRRNSLSEEPVEARKTLRPCRNLQSVVVWREVGWARVQWGIRDETESDHGSFRKQH